MTCRPGPPCHGLGCLGPWCPSNRAHYRVRRFALSAPEIRHTNRMTCGPGPPCRRLGCLGPWCPSNGISCGDLGTHRRVSLNKDSCFLEKGFTPRATITFLHSLPIVAPLFLHAPLLHARAAALAMASLGHPDRFQSEEALHLVCGLLGWSAPGLTRRIRAGAAPLSDLAAGEFVLFTSYISCGLALPISPFFLLLLEEFGLQLQHLTPHYVLQAAIFVHLCEMFVGVAPVLPSSATSSCWSSPGRLGTTSVPTTSRRGQIQPLSTSPTWRTKCRRENPPAGWWNAPALILR
jgi:hypothetical protein